MGHDTVARVNADAARLAEENTALQARQVARCAEENADRITRLLRGSGGAAKELGGLPQTPEGQMAQIFVEQAAQLSDTDYETARINLAKNAGVRASVLDRERAKLRHADDDELQGTSVLFNEPEPWPSPVDGAAVLADAARTLAAYVHMPNGAATAISLWVAAAHAFEAFQHAPRLNVTAATRGCGKTLLLDVVATLSPRALRLENLTQAVLFRIIAAQHPTLLVDECDRYLRDNQELVGLLNAGFTRGGVVPRCEGDQNEVRLFPVFAPVALSGIGELPGTLHDRSIVVQLERAKPAEVAQRFDSRHTERETEIKRRLIRWAADNATALADADPDMPQAFNRVADVWRPLFAVAAVAGGDWSARCAKAFQKLHWDEVDTDDSGLALLADVREVMCEAAEDRVFGEHLADLLTRNTEKRWAGFNHGKPISQRQIAARLRRFGIVSRTVRIGSTTAKGYLLGDFGPAFERYLPHPPAQSVTPSQPNNGAASSGFQSVTAKTVLRIEKPRQPNNGAACDAVTDKTGGVEL